MSCLTSTSILMALLAIAGDQKDEPTYEWCLVYMVREIPEGLKGALDDVADYNKHKKEFKERARVSVITKGLSESMARATSKPGIITFAIIPDGEGALKVCGAFQKDGKKNDKAIAVSIVQMKKIRYDAETEIGSSAEAKESKTPGQLGKGEARVFLLIARKLNRGIPQLAKDFFNPELYK